MLVPLDRSRPPEAGEYPRERAPPALSLLRTLIAALRCRRPARVTSFPPSTAVQSAAGLHPTRCEERFHVFAPWLCRAAEWPYWRKRSGVQGPPRQAADKA